MKANYDKIYELIYSFYKDLLELKDNINIARNEIKGLLIYGDDYMHNYEDLYNELNKYLSIKCYFINNDGVKELKSPYIILLDYEEELYDDNLFYKLEDIINDLNDTIDNLEYNFKAHYINVKKLINTLLTCQLKQDLNTLIKNNDIESLIFIIDEFILRSLKQGQEQKQMQRKKLNNKMIELSEDFDDDEIPF